MLVHPFRGASGAQAALPQQYCIYAAAQDILQHSVRGGRGDGPGFACAERHVCVVQPLTHAHLPLQCQ